MTSFAMTISRTHCVLFFGLFFSLVSSTCFAPNGTAQNNDPGAAPCSSDPTSPLRNTCCHTKWENPSGGDLKFGPTQDTCLPNGLCENKGVSTKEGEEQPPWTRYYRVFCTNENWDGCLNVCSTGSYDTNVAQITPCDGTNSSSTWCCGDTTDCCSPENNITAISIAEVFGTTASATSAPSSTNTVSPNGSKAHHLSRGAKAGIIIGSILGACILLALGFYAGRRMKARRNQQELDGTQKTREYHVGSKPISHELDSAAQTPELPEKDKGLTHLELA